MKWRSVLGLLCCWPLAALALTVDPPLTDPAMEARAKQLFYELRCLVCQGESIADSPAEVARDMRMEVRTQIAAGASDNEILDYFEHQFGEKVRMTPKFSTQNLLLWALPMLVLLLGAWLAARRIFRVKRR